MSQDSFRPINAVYCSEMLSHMERPPSTSISGRLLMFSTHLLQYILKGELLLVMQLGMKSYYLRLPTWGEVYKSGLTGGQQYGDLKVILSISGEGTKGGILPSPMHSLTLRRLVERYDWNGMDGKHLLACIFCGLFPGKVDPWFLEWSGCFNTRSYSNAWSFADLSVHSIGNVFNHRSR